MLMFTKPELPSEGEEPCSLYSGVGPVDFFNLSSHILSLLHYEAQVNYLKKGIGKMTAIFASI